MAIDTQMASYISKIRSKISSNWNLGYSNNLKDFDIVISVTINKQGNITNTKIIKNNAPQEYIEKSITAIKKSEPFGVIPSSQNSFTFQCFMTFKKGNAKPVLVINTGTVNPAKIKFTVN